MVFHKHFFVEEQASAVTVVPEATNLTRRERSRTSLTLLATWFTCSSVMAGYNGKETIRE